MKDKVQQVVVVVELVVEENVVLDVGVEIEWKVVLNVEVEVQVPSLSPTLALLFLEKVFQEPQSPT